ncbi:carboxylesterase family protein [Amycolatopsis sp. NEAU-NG30]|uniref:Carboxylic ester hydrolase n=1 Tax=Amycolatopsis melonis TaxID=3156488 RepID=A0ABV0L726_9PSEU
MTDPLLVDTTSGTVRGRALPGGGRCFAGIPFAAPPVGELRFRPPRPPEPWPGVRDAGRFPAAPAQGVSALMGAENTRSDFPGFPTASLGETAEDCLYLNVWTPGDGPRPVIVWIYGGGFEAGSASPPYTDGAALARGTGAVVVAANYRLGALGYLHLAGFGADWAGSANLGLQDQAAALRWVRDNIAAFGGDPGNVTVAGQSAGAFSVGALLATPAAAGTFHKAILQSGTTSRSFSTATATAMAEDLLTALGLDDPDGLRTVPVDRILAAQVDVVDGDIGRRNLPGGRAWGAVVDGEVLPAAPDSVAVPEIPLLIGVNRDEVRLFQVLGGDRFRLAEDELRAEMGAELFAAYRAREHDPAAARGAFLTDVLYRIPAARLAREHVEAGGRAYHYVFCDEPCGPQLGAFHGAELLHVFDKLALVGADTPERLAVRDALVGAWSAFAATGDPGWPVYSAEGSSRVFGGSAV